jgi:hypothetical protein
VPTGSIGALAILEPLAKVFLEPLAKLLTYIIGSHGICRRPRLSTSGIIGWLQLVEKFKHGFSGCFV